jgi:hypothetical protein
MTEERDGVTITYQYMVPENQQDAAFHTHGPGNNCLAVVEHKGRKLFIDCVGEMYLIMLNITPEGEINEGRDVIRYTDDLISHGITTDEKLRWYTEMTSEMGWEVWHMNPWFEVFSEEDDFGYGVYHEFYEAVDFALDAIKEDEYWDNLHKPENYVV